MKFKFETSLGECFGRVNNDRIVFFEKESVDIINTLYPRWKIAKMVDVRWLKININGITAEYRVTYID